MESPPQPSTSKQAAKLLGRDEDDATRILPPTMESPPEPSTSKQAARLLCRDENDTSRILPPTMKDEEAEILRLETENCAKKQCEEKPDKAADDERIAKIKFQCTACDMKEMVHYFGESPPFAYGIKFLEDTYVMRDPFQPPPPRYKPKPEYFIAMGANCSKCQVCVCRECSFYYTRTFCLRCAEKQINLFPVEAQTKLRKQIVSKRSS